MKKSIMVIVFSIIIVSILIQGFVPVSQDVSSKYTIYLKSRTFTPMIGMDSKIKEISKAPLTNKVHYIAQFDHILTTMEKELLFEQGIEVLDYIPDNAYFVSSNTRKMTFFSSYAASLISIDIKDKVPPRIIEQKFRESSISPIGYVNLLVVFYSDVSLDRANDVVQSLGAIIINEIPEINTLTVNIKKNRVKDLVRLDEVQWLEEEIYKIKEELDLSRGVVNVNAVQAVPYSLSGNGIKVMQHEPGWANYTHPDLLGRVTPADDCGIALHATHVAGIIIGNGFLSSGQYRGMAPQATIFGYCPARDSYTSTGDIGTDYDNAINVRDVDLSSSSWGLDIDQETECDLMGDYTVLSQLLDKIVRGQYNKKISIVYSAGNERFSPNLCGTNPGQFENYANIDPPHAAKNIIAVGAVYSSDSAITSFTSFGPVDDGRLKPELVAPGDENSGIPGITSTAYFLFSTPSYWYTDLSGTSMSAPHVSGAIALLTQAYRQSHNDLDLLPSSYKAILIQSAKDIVRTGPDYQSGYGLIDVKAAADIILMDSTDESNNLIIENEIYHMMEDTYELEVPSGRSELKVTLAWDDKESAVNPVKSLINNLDITLISPNKQTYLPYVLDKNNPSLAATNGVNNLDNVEQVRVINPISGRWKVVVRGKSVPVGPQTYSLVNTDLDFVKVTCMDPIVKQAYGEGRCQDSYGVLTPSGATFGAKYCPISACQRI